MANLGKIVYLSAAQKDTLFANGSVTVDGTTITYSANDLYLTPETGASSVTSVDYDSTNKKITKTVGSSTSDVVSVATLKTDFQLAKGDVGLGNVDNVQQYSASNPPPYPVTSVNGDTGAVTITVPTKTSDLTNDSGFLTSYTETDPTVPSWAKQSSKPTYTASEVGALPDSTVIPSKTSDLTNDSGFLTSFTETDPTVPSWAKQSSKPTYTKSEVGLGNVDNVQQYSVTNPPPYPVTSVNSKTGAVTVRELPSVTSSDNGKFLCVDNGTWAAVTVPNANGVSF